MDNREVDPQSSPIELPKKEQATETINGQAIPVGTVDEFTKAVFGKSLRDGLVLLPGQLMLGIRKYVTGEGKQYRLVWCGLGQVWLAAENTTAHRKKLLAWGAGYEITEKLGLQMVEW
jgi:hypothetical protein